MAPISTTAAHAPQVNGFKEAEKDEKLLILDDLIRARAQEKAQIPLLYFPKTERGVTDYEPFTGRDLDRMIDRAAKYYMRCGLEPARQKVVCQLGASDIAYVITFFALGRLGYTILCLSPRLAPNACAKLIEECGAIAVIPGKTAQLASLVAETQKLKPVDIVRLVDRKDFDMPESDGPHFQRDNIDRQEENSWTLCILHSSGTTGLPKPIYIPHKRVLMKIPPPRGQVEFNTFPMFHGYGNWCVLHGVMDRKSIYMYNPNLPVTADYVIKVMEHIRPDVLHVVPYTLELLASSERGVDAMKDCERVIFSGSACPDDLGNELIRKGVNVETFWGATEIGGLGASVGRPPGDNAWDYIRLPAPIAEHVWMKPVEDDTYECIYLKDLPALAVSNSNDPPGSFHSKDLFRKHPTIPNAWKHIGRLDDRLTLINGEKVLPLPMEGRIRQDLLIREAVVFGAGKSIPGLLAFRNEHSANMSDAEFVEMIWPTVQTANAHAESFSQISRETVVPLPAESDYPKTDKESIKRAQIYCAFAKEIETMYEKLEYAGTGTLALDIPSLVTYLTNTFKDKLDVPLSSVDDDFFAAGVNSLQAIQMRGLILKDLDLGGHSRELGQNVVFDMGNVARLARHLYALRCGEAINEDGRDEIMEMAALIKKYSTFEKHAPGSAPVPEGPVVLLTGATGSLGAHLLAQLLNRSDVRHVYCLVRGGNPQDRVLQTLKQRNLAVSSTGMLTCLTSDLSRADFGLSPRTYKELQSQTTAIFHSAWAVNFNLGIRSFEEQHIKGVHNLVQFSLSVTTPKPARFFFCSSVAAALATPRPAVIPEAPIYDLSRALSQGYARSKLVSEHIVRNAALDAGALTRNLRIGQIVGDRQMGLWNDTEAIPLIIRSALTVKALPALNETDSWLPVDTLATAILDLAGVTTGETPFLDTDPDLIYNLENPHTFSWTDSLLPELARSGLSFPTVPVSEWLEKLRAYEENGGDPERNPAVKLIDHFERMYAGKEDKGEVRFEIKTAVEHSEALRQAPRLVEDGYVGKFVKAWLEKWEGGVGLGWGSSG